MYQQLACSNGSPHKTLNSTRARAVLPVRAALRPGWYYARRPKLILKGPIQRLERLIEPVRTITDPLGKVFIERRYGSRAGIVVVTKLEATAGTDFVRRKTPVL